MTAETGRTTLVFFLSILLFMGFPIILIVTVPLVLFRFMVAKLAPYFRPELGKIVTTRGCLFAVEDYTNYSGSTIFNFIVLEGQVDLEKAIKSAENRILGARFPNGELKYPELKQYVSTFLGYYFWKDDKNFDIKNHIKIHQGQEKLAEDDLQELRLKMLQEPWAEKKSTWDITFIPGCYPAGVKSPGPHTVLIIRFHHTLGDGFSWFPLMAQELCQSEIKFAVPNYPEKSSCRDILNLLSFPFKASYNVADGLCFGLRKNVPFRLKKGMPKGRYNLAVSNTISLKKMKEIRAHFNVSLSSVVSAALTCAIRDLLASKRIEIPRVFHILTGQPLPEHSLKLRNYFGMILKYPIGEDDPVKILKYCDASYKHLRASADSRVFNYGYMLFGSCCSWILKICFPAYSITSDISNFPALFTDSIHFNGHKWIDFWFTVGLESRTTGLQFCASSFVNGFRISSAASSGILSRQEVNELSSSIFKHVDILHERIFTDI